MSPDRRLTWSVKVVFEVVLTTFEEVLSAIEEVLLTSSGLECNTPVSLLKERSRFVQGRDWIDRGMVPENKSRTIILVNQKWRKPVLNNQTHAESIDKDGTKMVFIMNKSTTNSPVRMLCDRDRSCRLSEMTRSDEEEEEGKDHWMALPPERNSVKIIK